MFDPCLPVNHVFNQIKQRIPSLRTIEQKSFSLLKIMIIFLAISFLIIVIFWIFDEEDDIVVQPFETAGIGENLDGKSLATLLGFDLQRIKGIYGPVREITVDPKSSSGNMIISRPLGGLSINPSIKCAPNTPLEYSLSHIVIVGAKGTSLSIGDLLLPIKEFLGNKGDVITGSFQRYNSSIIVVALLEDHHSAQNGIIPFEYYANISNDEQIPSYINDLAFMISLDLSKRRAQKEDDVYPQTWQTFKYVTQGRDAYNNYLSMKDINYLDKINYLDNGRNMALLAIKCEPGYTRSLELLSAIGFAYIEMGKYDEAEKIFKNTTVFEPFKSAVGLGLIYGIQGRYAESLNAFDDATRMNPQDEYAWNNKGVILSKQGNYSEAVKAFKNATEINKQCVTAWRYKGEALAHLGKNNSSHYDEAIQAYDNAIGIDNQNALSWEGKGTVLYNLKKYDEALDSYNETIELDSSNAAAWYKIGASFSALHKIDDARFAYNRAIQIDPSNKDAKIALRNLNSVMN
jgi:tetratricopeptide (TPR) repeat protein